MVCGGSQPLVVWHSCVKVRVSKKKKKKKKEGSQYDNDENKKLSQHVEGL